MIDKKTDSEPAPEISATGDDELGASDPKPAPPPTVPEDDRLTPEEVELRKHEAEMVLRKYEAKLGLKKVLWGTVFVGIVGILIPAAIEGWGLIFQKKKYEAQLQFEERQAEAKLEFQRQSRRQEFLEKHFETAINESLDLRIRFAEYYAYTVDGYDPSVDESEIGKEQVWARYWSTLFKRQNGLRVAILKGEEEIRTFLAKAPTEMTDDERTDLAIMEIKLDWLYDELNYTQPGREEKLRGSILSSTETRIVLQMASYLKENCKTAQQVVDLYGTDAFGRKPTLWLSPTEAYVVVGLQADTRDQAADDLAKAIELSRDQRYQGESLGEARIRINPNWKPLQSCADL